MKSRIFTWTIILIICIVAVYIFGLTRQIDYDRVYSRFLENGLDEFLVENQLNYDVDKIRENEHFTIDLKNTGEKQLVLITDGMSVDNIVISYKNKEFVLEEPLNLDLNMGSGCSDMLLVLEKDEKTYYYEYHSNRLGEAPDYRWVFNMTLYTYQNGEKIIVEEVKSEDGYDTYWNGEKTDSFSFDYDMTEGYDVILDPRDIYDNAILELMYKEIPPEGNQ